MRDTGIHEEHLACARSQDDIMCKIRMIAMFKDRKKERVHPPILSSRKPAAGFNELCLMYLPLLFCSRYVNLIDLHFFVAGCVHRQLLRVQRPIEKQKPSWVDFRSKLLCNATMVAMFGCMRMLFSLFLGGRIGIYKIGPFDHQTFQVLYLKWRYSPI